MKKIWPWILALFIVLLSLGTSLLLQFLLLESSFFGKKENLDLSNLNPKQFFLLIFFQALPFLFWGFVFTKFLGLKSYRLRLNFSLKEFIFVFLGLFLVNGLSSLILGFSGQEVRQFEELNKEILKKEPLPFFLAVVFLAPFYEEYFFRGILFAYLVQKAQNFFSKFFAWIYPAFLFSLLHLENAKNSFILVPIFNLALYLTALTHYKKNIGLSVSIHAAQNFLAAIAFLYLP